MAKKTAEKTKAPVKGEKLAKVAPAIEATSADMNDKTTQQISLRGKEFIGKVISDKASKTVTVEWERRVLLRKYERFERKYSRVYAHNPPAINAKLGDTVRIKETRPLSKTKHFIVIEVVKRDE